MVGRQHDPGVFEQVASLERGMELRELVIECPYLAVVLRHEVEHVGCRQRQFPVVDPLAERLRIVGGEIELARVLAEHRVVGRRRCVGPVDVEEVEVDEERPISRAVVEPGGLGGWGDGGETGVGLDGEVVGEATGSVCIRGI